MSTHTICLPAEKREQLGKAEVRRMRRLQDKMPAVVYGADKEVASVAIEHRHMLKALLNESVYSQVLELDIDGTKEQVVLKALQRHPYKPKIMHADFLRVDAKQKLHMQIPLHFMNEADSPGVQEGGVFTHVLTEAEVNCLPGNLPEFIEVDLGNIALDGSVHLSDLNLPKGVELVALTAEEPNDAVVASVHIPKVIADPEPEVAEEGEESAEGETGTEGDASGDAEKASSEGNAPSEGGEAS